MGKFNWINVSGGKDSTALLLWTLEQKLPNCRYVYADTQHEHESVYEYLTHLEELTGLTIERVETEGFLEMCKRKQRFPSSAARFCTEALKIVPLAKYMDSIEDSSEDNPHNTFVGIRAEESPSRAGLPPFIDDVIKYPPRKRCYVRRNHPLLTWTVDDVFDIHERHAIGPNPLYLMGMKRVGCFPCIMASKPELEIMFKRFPEVIDRLRDWEAQVAAASKRGGASFFPYCMLPNGVEGGIDTFVSMLDKGDEIPGLEQDLGGCMSVYGLCE